MLVYQGLFSFYPYENLRIMYLIVTIFDFLVSSTVGEISRKDQEEWNVYLQVGPRATNVQNHEPRSLISLPNVTLLRFSLPPVIKSTAIL
jgi:hypothetical protein